ncbi:DUF6923 family protein [Marilutibacter chinensis]|uniref:DUF6923 family protein n=1 Tax=Marilutibacter chinensis TaxID=2912247 RepID=UPI001F000F63|nr:isopeptide-forming domain-containing fimbrial protein [Lysobacter chinensis]
MLSALGLLGLSGGIPALAQTSVTNTATVAPPASVVDPIPDNDSDDAVITVTAPLPDFGSCDSTMYLTQGDPTALFRIDTSSNPFTYPSLGSASVTYNGSAYNPADNYIYASTWSGSAHVLLRIGSDGSEENLGDIVGGGINTSSNGLNTGEIGPDGFYYVKRSENTNQAWRVDLTTRQSALITLSQAVWLSDWAWHNGLLYGHSHETGLLYAVNPGTGVVTTVGNTGIANIPFGAMFGASNGVFGSLNTGGFYQFDLTTGTPTLISNSPATTGANDGAKCATTPMTFPADLAIEKDDGSDTYVPGEDVTYTIVVSNLGPFGAGGATVDDPLPTGITTASWTCGNATGGGACGVASGSGAIADVPVNLPAGATVTFSLTLAVPADFTGDLVNTATVTAPAGSPDPVPGNNTDTDTDTVAPAVVTVEKTANPAPGQLLTVGQTITYTLTTTIAGGPTSDVVTLADTLGAGLSFGSVTDAGSFTCSGALQCTLPAGTAPGTYALSYTAVVEAGAGATVSNAVTPSGGDGPTCGTCTVQHAVQPNFGTCSATMYLAQNQPTGLFQFDTSSNPFIVDPVGPTSAITYNAIAVNPVDNYIYGLRGPAPGTLVRVGSDGSVLDVGTITGFPINSVIGEFGPDGTYYTGNGTTLYRIDITTMTATAVPLSQTINGQDLAWHDGQLYIAAPDAGLLYAIDPANGNVTPIGSTTVAGAFGGMFGATNGVFGSNNNGGFYRFDLTTGQATLISDLPGSGSNDGAKCATTPLEFPADLAITKTDGSDTYVPGEDVTYTIVVSNLGPFGAAGATVNDPLPSGIADAGWTCGNATGGGSCGVANGTGAIVDAPVNLPAGGSVTFSLTLSVPDGFTGDLVNTATVTAPDGSPDPTPGNNTATDTDTREFPVISTAKTADPAAGAQVQAGQTITYTLTVTVAEAPTSEPFVLTDTLDAGLSFGAVTDPGAFACTGTLECTLPTDTPAGTYAVTYTATVDADATGTIGNSVTGTGGGDVDPECVPCRIEHEVAPPTVAVAKTSVPGTGAEVQPGDTLTYTLTTTVATAATTAPLVLTDTLSAGLTFGAVTDPGAYVCTGALQCTLPAGTVPGTYALTYTATVDADATGTVGNSVAATGGGGDPPVCDPCTTEHGVEPTEIAVAKTVDPANGSQVVPGQTLTYTLTATVSTSATTDPLVLTDTLGLGLSFGAVTNAGAFSCTGTLECTLPAGTLPGSYALTYTATVDADASGTVGNSVAATGGGGDPPVCDPCTTEHGVEPPTINIVKSADPADGSQVVPGQTLTYTLTATVATAFTTEPLVLTDTLGPGLTFGAVTDAGAFSCTGTLECTLPTGTLPGAYAVTYTATVDADASGTVGNSVAASGGGDDPPVCDPCTTEHEVAPATIGVAKSADPVDGSQVVPGQTLTYTLTATVATAFTTEPLVLTDTLGPGLTFGAVTDAGAFSCTGTLECTLPTGAAPGSYALTYTATVEADATGTVGNSVVASGGGGDDPVCSPCETEHEIEPPTIGVAKTADPADGTQVQPGDTLTYTLTATVATSATTEPLVLTDTLGTGLSFGAVTDTGAFSCTGTLVCTLPAGTLPGTYALTYTATVDADATGTVGNSVVASGGGGDDPVCSPCETGHEVEPPTIGVVKSADPGTDAEVRPGDTLTYTLTATIATSATTAPLVLTDTLGTGLSFGAVTDAGAFSCTGTLQCTLPTGTLPGAYAVTYTATVDADATGTVGNSVVAGGGGGDEPECVPCTTEHEIEPPTIGVTKTAAPGEDVEVRPGDTLTYTLTATVATSATTEPLVLTDTLGAGLSFAAVTDAGAFACTGELVCTLPAGTLPGTYALTYTATVDADATGTVGNSVVAGGGGGDDPECVPCTTEHEIEPPTIGVAKTAAPGEDVEVRPGDTLTYTLTATIATSATTEPLVLTDTLGTGLTFGAVTDAGAFACTGELVCTLPAGTLPGTYAVTYTATVDADATGTVGNSVVASGGGGEDPECVPCETGHEIELPTITTAKTADPGENAQVRPGDTLTYTLTTTVATSATTEPFVLTDTLGEGLSFGAVTDADAFACTGELVCTLPAGTLPGTYAVTYTATVDTDAAGTVGNSVVASGGGDEDPGCDPCTTEHEIELPVITTVKSSDPPSGAEVRAGDVITYTLAVTVENSATTEPLLLGDTLGAGQTLLAGSIETPAGGSCEARADGLDCTLAAGTLPGSHAFVYRTQVDPDAVGEIGNTVVPSGGGGGNPPICANCETAHPLAEPLVSVAKTSTPGDGAEVSVGDTIDYTLTVTIENAAITTPVRLTDTPGAGLTVGDLPAGCSGGNGGIVCTVAAGTVPGTYTFSYPATVNPSAVGEVNNAVVSEYGGSNDPICEPCGTSHRVLDEAELRIVKTVGVRSARIGDIVRYTLTVENVGVVNVTDGIVVDTPPAGFSYVEGSMTVDDGDDAFTLSPGRHPLEIGGLDIAVGEQATIVYMLRIGAGVRQGTQVNEAVARNPDGDPISNVATAQVTIDADPLLDDSLIFGTVFDDRDGDGWQDNAELTGVRVQGGFAPGAYLAASTTLARGEVSEPVADASAPLLHGIAIGTIAARQSEADPAEAHQVVIRQRLAEEAFTGAAFTDDFVLTSDQGVTLRMDAEGRTTIERSGDAAKGLNGAMPTVERRIAQGEGGVVVDYVIGNAGIDERGIPGVRIASVEGLLIETDQFGRYHLADVPGGERGYRNFILKVDPSTLPPGTAFTTDNPRVRRITPGIPVRFDFGVQLPVTVIPGGTDTVELTLGEVIFAPGSAEVRPEYVPAIARMAEQIDAHRGGEVVITADGDSEALAFDRATAVRDLLVAQVAPEHAQGLVVNVRTEVDALVAAATEGGALLGTVLFDTDRSEIRPEFAPLLDRVAARLEGMGGGAIAVVGHTDVRGSHAYNTALGMRRARAVYEALAERLSPELRARVRVESSNDPTAPVGPERK